MLLFCLLVSKLLAQKSRFYAKTTPFVPHPFVLCPLFFVLVFVLCRLFFVLSTLFFVLCPLYLVFCPLRQISKAFPLFVANKGGCHNEKRRKMK